MPHPVKRLSGALATMAALAIWALSAWSAAASLAADAAEPFVIDQARALAGDAARGDAPGFPVTIAAPGVYRLAGDLKVPAGHRGIVITSEGVTLDLRGHQIRGPVSCKAQPREVVCDAPLASAVSGVEVRAGGVLLRGGSVGGFAGHGLSLAYDGTVEQMRLADNAGSGVYANTSAARPVRVRSVTAFRNGQDGVWLQSGTLDQAQALLNGRHGLALGALVVFSASHAELNQGQDIDGGAPAMHLASAAAVPIRTTH